MSDTELANVERQDTAEANRLLSAGQQAEADGNRWVALEHYESAFEADPENPDVCFHLAYLLDLVGEEDEALHLYEQVCQKPSPALNALIN